MSIVDVVIPAYNSALTVAGAVMSAQRLAGSHVIVIDDGSDDRTAMVAESLGVDVVRQENQGASSARARGLKYGTAEFVIFLDADDEIVAEGAQCSIDLLNSNPQFVVAAGRVMGQTPSGRKRLLPQRYATVTTESLLETGVGPWPPAAAVIRRSALETASQLPIPTLHTRFAEDYEMILRLAQVGQVKVHSELAARYRLFAGKSSRTAEAALRDKERIRAYYSDHLNVPVQLMSHRDIRAAAQVRSARTAWAQNRHLLALVHALRVLIGHPDFIVRKFASKARPGRDQ